ncbi:MAG TPA: FliM/FliN family flagellar motor switch protein [Noviherbaspirillum sp.]
MVEAKERPPAQLVELPDVSNAQPSGTPIVGDNIQLLRGVKVSVTAVVGDIQTTLGELMSLKESSVLKIERHVDDPIDIIVDGKLFARGQLVAIDDNFGVRITEVAPA